MFNGEIPSRAELPSTAQLVKSTIIAAAAAVVILVTIILPAEYGIDPTGIGRALKLTDMGEIKKQLGIEAETDRQRDRQQAPATAPDRRSSLPGLLVGLLVSPAAAQPAAAGRTDEVIVTLKPNEGVEYKMTMSRGGVVQFSWRTDGGKVNYDMHGTPRGGGKETSYKKGSQVASDTGTLTAAYDGSHGWFWRNRNSADVTITLKVNGAYTEIKRMN